MTVLKKKETGDHAAHCPEILGGKNSLRRIVKWAKGNREKLKSSLALKNGISLLSTFSLIASGIDEERLVLVFTDWIGNILSTKGIYIVINGKALKVTAIPKPLELLDEKAHGQIER